MRLSTLVVWFLFGEIAAIALSLQTIQGIFSLVAGVEVGLDDPLIRAIDHAPFATDRFSNRKTVAIKVAGILILRFDVPIAVVIQVAVSSRRGILGQPQLDAGQTALTDGLRRLVAVAAPLKDGLHDPLSEGVDDAVPLHGLHAGHTVLELTGGFILWGDRPQANVAQVTVESRSRIFGGG